VAKVPAMFWSFENDDNREDLLAASEIQYVTSGMPVANYANQPKIFALGDAAFLGIRTIFGSQIMIDWPYGAAESTDFDQVVGKMVEQLLQTELGRSSAFQTHPTVVLRTALPRNDEASRLGVTEAQALHASFADSNKIIVD